ncbi:hypothetical protein L593_09340 [Salinarchaeum sp. Harcht-Bsk1]|uniref:hypothetical protein n=1 Tax=Salinarchaeum sp. Harcht-Bsk1 TaxID=1333523 RepID=UPI0003422EBF|nr:hypothetical protein [Salinarchaeum sp. Harcht-Bsk1]AGN01813.1 hypothetical protein L593_09340 [Salinarchaeum sp. Harcht-Bsk1]
MAREAGPSAADRLGILGVDPADGRALAEVPRWVPADATALYSVPDVSDRFVAGRASASTPPVALLALARRLAGRGSFRTLPDEALPGDDAGLAAAVDAAAAECDVTRRDLTVDAGTQSASSRRRWVVGAWTVTLLAIGASLGSIARWLLIGDLLSGLLAILATVGSLALLVGFAFAAEAAAIRRFDHTLADAVTDALAADEDNSADSQGTGGTDRTAERPVLVVPARHAAGVAAILRERGVRARALRVEADASPATVS